MRLAIRTVQDDSKPGLFKRLLQWLGFFSERPEIDTEAKRLVFLFLTKIIQPSTSQEKLKALLKRHFAFSDDDIEAYCGKK